jgi:GAF domain-containing protein
MKTGRRKMTKLKRGKEATAARSGGSSISYLKEQLDLRTRELNEAQTKLDLRTRELGEALEQQTATAEILRIISSSPTDVQPVFDMIARNFVSLCGGIFGAICTFDGNLVHFSGAHGFSPEQLDGMRAKYPVQVDDRSVISARAILAKVPVHIQDVMSDPHYDREHAAVGAYRRMLAVPMLREGVPLGAIVAAWAEAGAIPRQHEDLLKVFAAQAVIAIENVRLLNELRESLQQQTATADVLQVISSSPGELEPVFQAMLENATRICEAQFGTLVLCKGDACRHVAAHGAPHSYAELRVREPVFRPGPEHPLSQTIKAKKVLHIVDLSTEPESVRGRLADLAGARTLLVVPFRQDVRPFADKQIALVQNFANQAVIAIENTRLLNELRQRTDDLSESLEQQTATSEVLRVISSSAGELELVFQAMLENAVRICEARFGALWLYDGNKFRIGAMHNGPAAFVEFWQRGPHSPTPASALGRVSATKRTVQIADMKAEEGYAKGDPLVVAGVELARIRSFVVVPMLKEGDLIGAIGIYQQEVRPFNDKQVALVANFAAQAVIAIENTRLLNELRQRTDEGARNSKLPLFL